MKKQSNFKAALDSINLSKEASDRIYNNIVNSKNCENVKSKPNFYYKATFKYALVCSVFLIIFLTSHTTNLYSNKTTSFLSSFLNLSDKEDNKVAGDITKYENEDLLFKIEECFNDIDQTTLFVSTTFKKYNDISLINLDSNIYDITASNSNTFIYAICNCKIVNNTLYSIIVIPDSAKLKDLTITYNELVNNTNIPINLIAYNTVNIPTDSYTPIENLMLSNFLITKDAIYLNIISSSKENSYKAILNFLDTLDTSKLYVILSSKKHIYINNKFDNPVEHICSNFINKNESTDTYTLKFEFDSPIAIDEIKSVCINNSIFFKN